MEDMWGRSYSTEFEVWTLWSVGRRELVNPVLKMRFQFQPGDVIFFKSTLLEHYVLPSWEIGIFYTS